MCPATSTIPITEAGASTVPLQVPTSVPAGAPGTASTNVGATAGATSLRQVATNVEAASIGDKGKAQQPNSPPAGKSIPKGSPTVKTLPDREGEPIGLGLPTTCKGPILMSVNDPSLSSVPKELPPHQAMFNVIPAKSILSAASSHAGSEAPSLSFLLDRDTPGPEGLQDSKSNATEKPPHVLYNSHPRFKEESDLVHDILIRWSSLHKDCLWTDMNTALKDFSKISISLRDLKPYNGGEKMVYALNKPWLNKITQVSLAVHQVLNAFAAFMYSLSKYRFHCTEILLAWMVLQHRTVVVALHIKNYFKSFDRIFRHPEDLESMSSHNLTVSSICLAFGRYSPRTELRGLLNRPDYHVNEDHVLYVAQQELLQGAHEDAPGKMLPIRELMEYLTLLMYTRPFHTMLLPRSTEVLEVLLVEETLEDCPEVVEMKDPQEVVAEEVEEEEVLHRVSLMLALQAAAEEMNVATQEEEEILDLEDPLAVVVVVEVLADLGLRMQSGLAQWAPTKWPSRALSWWDTLPSRDRQYFSGGWNRMLLGIWTQFLNDNWVKGRLFKFEEMKFRQKNHDDELPLDFLQRRIQYHSFLYPEDLDGAIAVSRILRTKPTK
ncbi:hypothetical protein DXG01_016987 [Tephrocybe rancida]|nr:hypothetical protein DXG01_016987 [Tephrocybe rancida]